MSKLTEAELRYKRVRVCKECGDCEDSSRCQTSRKKLDDNYGGIRFTADGFDCALPVSVDSHGSCSFACQYCFSEFIGSHKDKHAREIKQCNLNTIENILSGRSESALANNVRMALKRDQKQPCPMQLGALADPFDNIERAQGWFFKFAEIVKKYNQPVRISTKGKLFAIPEYLDAVSHPELFWVAFSLITPDDELLEKIDVHAPNATERLKCMKLLSQRGVTTSLRMRPIIPNVSDCTPKHPKAYKELIERAAEAGAKAVSMEALFAPSRLLGDSKQRWDEMQRIISFPLIEYYKRITPKGGSCIRPSRAFVEDMFHACREVAHNCGMVFAVSDPTMKHLNDTGNCCGMLPNDPIWGNWQRENANQAIIDAKNKPFIVGSDYIPAWAHHVNKNQMCMSSGPKGCVDASTTWAEKLLDTWNDLKTNRGVLQYFQGILKPTALTADKQVQWAYREPERVHMANPVFKV
jgi:DNA repair photolyase